MAEGFPIAMHPETLALIARGAKGDVLARARGRRWLPDELLIPMPSAQHHEGEGGVRAVAEGERPDGLVGHP